MLMLGDVDLCSSSSFSVQFHLNLRIIRMTIMCPVPRTNDIDDVSLNPYNYYNEAEETNAYQLSKVTVDWSMRISHSSQNLAANCRNISDEVFPGVHLGDRWISRKNNSSAGLKYFLLPNKYYFRFRIIPLLSDSGTMWAWCCSSYTYILLTSSSSTTSSTNLNQSRILHHCFHNTY